MTPKTVIRPGYGRGYDLGVFGSIFGHNVTQNLPVLGIQNLAPANNFDTVFTLAQGPTTVQSRNALDSRPKGPNGFPLLPNGVTPAHDFQRYAAADCGCVEFHHSAPADR